MNEITDEKLRQLGTVKCSTYCDLVQGACVHKIASAALEAREEVARLTSLTTVMEDEITRYFERAQKAEARVAELEQHVCDECDGDGWRENAVQGRHPCVCVAEMEPFIQLWARVAELEATLASSPPCPTCRPTHTDLMVAPEDECQTCCGSGALVHGTQPCPDCAE